MRLFIYFFYYEDTLVVFFLLWKLKGCWYSTLKDLNALIFGKPEIKRSRLNRTTRLFIMFRKYYVCARTHTHTHTYTYFYENIWHRRYLSNFILVLLVQYTNYRRIYLLDKKKYLKRTLLNLSYEICRNK